MTLTDGEISNLKDALDSCSRPLFFFDGDCDGLAAFLLFYKYVGEGKGVMISGRPILSENYIRHVQEFSPDAIFVLDVPSISDEFFNAVKTPIFWLDHHLVSVSSLPKNVSYFNPRNNDVDDGRPTSFWAYLVVKDFLWLAMVGIIGDYSFDLVDEFREVYPDLLPLNIKNQGEALFSSPLGKLVKIINFNLKGGVSKSLISVKILSRIDSPLEILDKSSSKGRFIFKKFEQVNSFYKKHFSEALTFLKPDDLLFIYLYHNDKFAMSADLSNELKYHFPKKVVIVGRLHDGKVVMSIRSETIVILDSLEKALVGTSGHGGGHPLACGAVVSKDEFDGFKERFLSFLTDKVSK